jgi:exopolyphosphatase/guanosine-5'-triphosphate,3'-diphosphate pyrophosphatase
VERLARQWSADDGHATVVARLAEQLFDQTRDVHDLGDTDRELLGYAARLHDVGARISPDKHHKHGAYVVENAGLRGFSPDEVALLACLVRFHRGGGPRSTYPPYAALTPVERHAGRILMGILRVAHGLGHGAVDDITDIGVSVGDRGLTIRLDGKNPHRAMLDAQERSDIFERAIGMPTSFEIVASGSLAR